MQSLPPTFPPSMMRNKKSITSRSFTLRHFITCFMVTVVRMVPPSEGVCLPVACAVLVVHDDGWASGAPCPGSAEVGVGSSTVGPPKEKGGFS